MLEFHHLDEICVPLQVSLSTYFTTLYLLMISCIWTLSSCELVLELFLCVGIFRGETVVLQTVLGLDLRLVRLILVAVLLRF